MRGYQQKCSYSFNKPLSFAATNILVLLPHGSLQNTESENLDLAQTQIKKCMQQENSGSERIVFKITL